MNRACPPNVIADIVGEILSVTKPDTRPENYVMFEAETVTTALASASKLPHRAWTIWGTMAVHYKELNSQFRYKGEPELRLIPFATFNRLAYAIARSEAANA